MSVRPTLKHIIGTTLNEKEKKLVRAYSNEHEDDDLKDLLSHEFAEGKVHDLLVIPERESGIFGVKPCFHADEALLHDHQAIWSLIEVGIFDSTGFEKKIPYDDYSAFIGASIEVIKTLPLSVRQEIRYYDGNWGRKYKHSPLYYFDEELDIALELFQKMGVKVERKQLDRYIVLEWE